MTESSQAMDGEITPISCHQLAQSRQQQQLRRKMVGRLPACLGYTKLRNTRNTEPQFIFPSCIAIKVIKLKGGQ
jgi:ssDNA-binding Zn-finger/Zn-ribbon topoisomerase 1